MEKALGLVAYIALCQSLNILFTYSIFVFGSGFGWMDQEFKEVSQIWPKLPLWFRLGSFLVPLLPLGVRWFM